MLYNSYHPFQNDEKWNPCIKRRFNPAISLPDAVDIQLLLREPDFKNFRYIRINLSAFQLLLRFFVAVFNSRRCRPCFISGSEDTWHHLSALTIRFLSLIGRSSTTCGRNGRNEIPMVNVILQWSISSYNARLFLENVFYFLTTWVRILPTLLYLRNASFSSSTSLHSIEAIRHHSWWCPCLPRATLHQLHSSHSWRAMQSKRRTPATYA